MSSSSPFSVPEDVEAMPWTGVLVAGLTTSAFAAANLWLKTSRWTQPATTAGDDVLSWRWRNVLLSLIHSLVSGLWAICW